MKKKNNFIERQVTLDGMLTISKLDNELRTADFECCEDTEIVPFVGRFRVQAMHNGDVYMQELPKRIRNKPLFKLDNSSLSLGRDGHYYYSFRLPESEVERLPQLLMRESRQMATKVRKNILNDEEA